MMWHQRIGMSEEGLTMPDCENVSNFWRFQTMGNIEFQTTIHMASIEMSDHWDKGISYYNMVNIEMSDY
jgi:hypothetical protein